MLADDLLKMTKKIENILSEMGAEGRGLNQKLDSVANKVNEATTKKIRFIATIRNKMVHESNFEVDTQTEENIKEAYDYVIANLIVEKKSTPSTSSNSTENINNGGFWKKAVGLGFAVLVVYGILRDR